MTGTLSCVDISPKMLEKASVPDSKFRLGKTKVFLGVGMLDMLEQSRMEYIAKKAVSMQMVARAFLARKELRRRIAERERKKKDRKGEKDRKREKHRKAERPRKKHKKHHSLKPSMHFSLISFKRGLALKRARLNSSPNSLTSAFSLRCMTRSFSMGSAVEAATILNQVGRPVGSL